MQEQKPMQGKERKKRKAQDKVSAHLFMRDNGNGLGGQGGRSQAGLEAGLEVIKKGFTVGGVTFN